MVLIGPSAEAYWQHIHECQGINRTPVASVPATRPCEHLYAGLLHLGVPDFSEASCMEPRKKAWAPNPSKKQQTAPNGSTRPGPKVPMPSPVEVPAADHLDPDVQSILAAVCSAREMWARAKKSARTGRGRHCGVLRRLREHHLRQDVGLSLSQALHMLELLHPALPRLLSAVTQ